MAKAIEDVETGAEEPPKKKTRSRGKKVEVPPAGEEDIPPAAEPAIELKKKAAIKGRRRS